MKYLQEKHSIDSKLFDSASLDKEYNTLMGLTKRENLPENISVQRAKEIKLLMQERIMQMWNQISRS